MPSASHARADGHDLGMGGGVVPGGDLVHALAHDLAVADDHAAERAAGAVHERALAGEGDGPSHERRVVDLGHRPGIYSTSGPVGSVRLATNASVPLRPDRRLGGKRRRLAGDGPAGRVARLRHSPRPGPPHRPAVAGAGAGRGRGGHLAPAHRLLRVRQRLPPPAAPRPGGGDPGCPVRRAVGVRDRGRLAGERLLAARCPVRRGGPAHRPDGGGGRASSRGCSPGRR